uniref:Uncharacterized protein n=1 Tax=Chenopodium quinoa TaxID=63459 RepID=A0A803MQN9_CHEQI
MDTHVQQLSSGEEEEIDTTIKDKGRDKNQQTSSDKSHVILTANMDPQMEILGGSIMKLKVGDNDDTPRTSPELEQFDENASLNIV